MKVELLQATPNAEIFIGQMAGICYGDEQHHVDWEDVSGNADFIVHKMEMYNTDGKLVQCVNLKTQYRPKDATGE